MALNEKWNGSSWAEDANLNTARRNLGGAGADNTSALAFGGDISPGSPRHRAETESWNGSAWT